MHTEYEVRILEIDKDKIIKKLKKIGAKFQWDQIQRRYVYDFIPKIDGKWIRLRTNGIKASLTIKDIVSSEVDGTRELEVEVSDFNNTNKILNELGYEAKGYQENRRCQYVLDDVEIDIDDWPYLPTYLEIEGPSEDRVFEVLDLLGYKKTDITTKDVEGIYLDYGYDLKNNCDLKLEEERK